MRKAYSRPSIGVVNFRFSEHVVASGGSTCQYINYMTNAGGPGDCSTTHTTINGEPGTWVFLNG